MTKKANFFLVLIIFLAAVLRFYKLGQIPPGINWDEASIGFNAYMVSQTGRDEFGEKFPVAFRSYDDYRASLPIYLLALTFKFLPVNEWSLRFPSAFLGTFTVLLTYFLTKELFKKTPFGISLALLSSFLLAISPWHIHFSRFIIEANIAVFFVVGGILFFLKFANSDFKATWHLILFSSLSALFFSGSLYAYHSTRGFTPALIFVSFLVFWRKINQKKRYLFFFLFLFLLLSFPLIRLITQREVQTRIESVSIFKQEKAPLDRSIKILELTKEQNLPFIASRIFYNRRFEYLKELVVGYFYHYSPNFFFIKAGNSILQKPAPNVGLLYLIELPFLLLGFYYLSKEKPAAFWFLIFWFLLVPIPASFTTDAPYAARTENFLPLLQIIIAFGIIRFLANQAGKKRKIYTLLVAFLFACNVFYFLHQYFVHFPIENSQFWQYGYRDLAKAIKEETGYDKVIIFVRQNEPTRDTILERAHAFLAFYFLPNAQEYLKNGGTNLCQIGVTGQMHFDNFYFYPLTCFGASLTDKQLLELMGKNNLVIIDPQDFENRVVGKGIYFRSAKEKIQFLNGKVAVELIRT